MTTQSSFQRAERTQVKFKIGIQGPSGSGKTKGALALATHLVPGGRIAVIDTENSSASFYADDYDFERSNLGPPFTTERYLKLIEEAIEAGFDVLVIDTITHEWAGTGGILERKDDADRRPGANSFGNWQHFTKEHNKFIAAILEAPIHIIATMRSKMDYALEQRDGKAVPRKIGMAPIQREGMEYEFGIVFDVQMDHRAKVSKKRIDALDTEALYDLTSPKVARILQDWMKSGKPMLSEAPAERAAESAEPELPQLTLEEAEKVPLPGPKGSWGGKQGTPLGKFSVGQLTEIREFFRGSLAHKPTKEKERAALACTVIIEARERAAPSLAKEPENSDHLALPADGKPIDASVERVSREDAHQPELAAP